MTQSIIKANDFNIDVSSGASSTVKLDVTSLVADASSGASIQLEGTAKNVNYDGSSGASIKGERLHALNVNADVSSGASIKLFVAETLVGDASSGGSILYKGNPKSKNLDSGKMSGGSIRPF